MSRTISTNMRVSAQTTAVFTRSLWSGKWFWHNLCGLRRSACYWLFSLSIFPLNCRFSNPLTYRLPAQLDRKLTNQREIRMCLSIKCGRASVRKKKKGLTGFILIYYWSLPFCVLSVYLGLKWVPWPKYVWDTLTYRVSCSISSINIALY